MSTIQNCPPFPIISLILDGGGKSLVFVLKVKEMPMTNNIYLEINLTLYFGKRGGKK